MNLPNCPGCGAKAVRDDTITKGVEGAVRCTECSFCALITDWEAQSENASQPSTQPDCEKTAIEARKPPQKLSCQAGMVRAAQKIIC